MHPFAVVSFPEGPASKEDIMVSASALLYHYYTGYISIQVRKQNFKRESKKDKTGYSPVYSVLFFYSILV